MRRTDTKGLALRIMFQDEARFGRICSPKACWVPMPVRLHVARQVVREYVYVFGAVSPCDGRHDSLVLPSILTENIVYIRKLLAGIRAQQIFC